MSNTNVPHYIHLLKMFTRNVCYLFLIYLICIAVAQQRSAAALKMILIK